MKNRPVEARSTGQGTKTDYGDTLKNKQRIERTGINNAARPCMVCCSSVSHVVLLVHTVLVATSRCSSVHEDTIDDY